MPLQATSGAASYDAFGGGAAAVPNYIEEVFSSYLWTTSGSDQTLATGIDMTKGALTWIKSRSNAFSHVLQTGPGGGILPDNALSSNTTGAFFGGNYRIADSTTGFTMGTDYYTGTPQTAVVWTFRKQPKFFDVVTFSTTNSANARISHNLNSVPAFYVIKRVDGAGGWFAYHGSLGRSSYLQLQSTNASASSTDCWGTSDPTTTDFGVNEQFFTNGTVGLSYIAYVFASNAGGFGLTGTDNVISCGSFTGSASGTTVNLGWEPQWVLIKRSSGNTDNWRIYDNMRGMTASNGGQLLYADTSGSETTNSRISVNATGFGFVDDAAYGNIYIAIRRGPMKVPTSGTGVFNPYTATLSAGTVVNAGLTPDLLIGKYRGPGTDAPRWVDRLRGFATATGGTNPQLRSDTTDAEASSTAWSYNWNNTGYVIGNALNGTNSVIYSLVRAPSFFDEVCYTGTGVANTAFTHNLTVTPELMIVKPRSAATAPNWRVWSPINSTDFNLLQLSTDGAASSSLYSSSNVFPAIPTATTFTVGGSGSIQLNESGQTFVAYLFATCAGVSKVTTFTGNGSSQTINCGFTGGARFVLIKRVDSTGNWVTFDTARGIVSGNDPALYLNSTAAEVTGVDAIDPDSTGFIVNQESTFNLNVSSATYLVLAIA